MPPIDNIVKVDVFLKNPAIFVYKLKYDKRKNNFRH